MDSNNTNSIPICKLEKISNNDDLMGQVEKNLMLNLYPLLILLCTIGNLANLLVYRHKFLRSSTTIRTLAAKGVANMLSLFCILPNYLKSIPQLTNDETVKWVYWNFLPYTIFNTNTFATFAIWLTVIMSLERYLLITIPIRSRNWCTMRNAYLAIILTFLCSIGLQLPNMFARQLYKTECFQLWNGSYKEIAIYTYTVPKKYRNLENVYYYLYSLTTILLPMVVLIWTTVSINYHLFWIKPSISSTNSATRSSMEQKLCVTRLSLATTLCHLVFETPHVVVFIWAAVRTSDVGYWKNYQSLTAWANILSMVNGALPFFVYLACSRRFRTIAKAQLCRQMPSNNNDDDDHRRIGRLGIKRKADGENTRNGEVGVKNGSSTTSTLIGRKSVKKFSADDVSDERVTVV